MPKSIEVDLLEKEVMKYLTEYKEDILEVVENVSNRVGKEATSELKEESPKLTGDYAKGWRLKKDKVGKNRYIVKIHNKTNYQLTHLLEFGHHKRDGTDWVDAQPHIRDVEQKYGSKFADLLENKIRRDSK